MLFAIGHANGDAVLSRTDKSRLDDASLRVFPRAQGGPLSQSTDGGEHEAEATEGWLHGRVIIMLLENRQDGAAFGASIRGVLSRPPAHRDRDAFANFQPTSCPGACL